MLTTGSSDHPDGEPPRIVALLRLASESGQAALYGRLQQLGHTELRPSHFRVLRYPGPDGRRPSELARQVGLSKQALNPLLNDLEAWGYVERRADASDQRGVVVRLTPRGRRLLTTIRRLHAEIEDEWRDRVGGRDFDALRRALTALLAEPAPGRGRARARR